ncbi:protein kinase domain-containing protein [Streptomyces griseorubiginosus]|uniref:protein kinase domain-containing protein n=1 Tax=Streptomyces griseorubiginosus TaxID=67304 RepID=UPI00113FF326|nr:protein kinase [Streptomyces griseorubiginosus]
MPTDDSAAALRRTGASPLRPTDPPRVGPYVPVALLGSGGMGRVYLARPADDGPGLVAVKVIRPEYAEDPRFRRRFEREASVHARLRTPHAPRLCGTGFEDDLLWMATEYLPGFDLSEAVQEAGALAPAAVWRLVAELGQALAALGAEEIVHRDLKPSNVLLTVRGAHVIDFGISKAVDASAITGTGNRVGTPAYMSPEHLREGLSDGASDLFSLGGTLVYAAAGRAPFGDGTGVDVMHRVAFEEPNPEVIGEIAAADPALGALLTACLAKDPARRPTPRELIETARARALPSVWPEPLGEEVAARQRAYETLYRMPVANMVRLRGAQGLPPRPLRPVAEPVLPGPSAPSAPEPVVPHPAASAERPPASAAEPSERLSGPAGVVARLRERPWRVVAAGLVVCVVAALAVLLTLPDGPGGGSTQGADGVQAIGGAPRNASVQPGSATSGGQSRPDLDGALDKEATEGGKADADANGDPDPERSTASSPAAGQSDEASAPGDAPDASPSPTPSDDSTTTGPGTAPWLSECTYYNGNGRTRLGDSGKRVRQVQCMLTERGYAVGDGGVDGEFGTGTESAVEAFQSDRGLDADGVVAHDTWSALRSAE